MSSGKHAADKRDLFNFSKNRKKAKTENEEYTYEQNSSESSYENGDDIKTDFFKYNMLNNDANEEMWYDDDENKHRVVKIIIIIFLVIAILACVVYFYIKNNVIPTSSEEDTSNEVYSEKMIEELQGYNVLGEISIDSIGVKQYILDSTDSEALKIGVGKIDNGASINKYGNFCIAGHNTENVFKRLSELNVDDEITITDKNLKDTIYVIISKTSVEPSNLECLLQDKEKKEITLITCEDGAVNRLIIKAEEKK